MANIDLNAEIGTRIRKQRELLGYTRETLSEKANISTQFLADIEMGRKSMTAATIIGLSTSLCVTSDYILFGKNADDESTDEASLAPMMDGLSKKERDGAISMLMSYVRVISSLRSQRER